jgi:hypothetical protein
METFYGWNLCVRRSGPRWAWQQTLEMLEPAHWMNYHWNPEGLQAPGYVPIIWSNYAMAPEYRNSVVKALHDNPNHTWLFINEGHLQEQANMTPAEAVDLVLWFINLADKTGVNMNWCGPNCAINMDAQIVSGLSGVAWWREFLRLLRLKGIPRPSAHGIHMYNSTDKDMFLSIWACLREWRWQFIGRDAPFIITEMCAENQPLPLQIEVMNESHRLLEIGLREGPSGQNGVMGVFRFVATQRTDGTGRWPNCALTEVNPDKRETMRLTPLGQHWKALQARMVG